MLKIRDVVNIMEEFAPLEGQASYDNCGLFYGDLDWDCKGVLVTLDTSVDVVNEAISNGANMIIEHHPSVFGAIKKIDLSYPKHSAIALAIKNDIAIYSAHTCVDFTKGGLNDYVMELLDCEKYDLAFGIMSDMRVGTLKDAITLSSFVKRVKEVFNDDHVTFVGNSDKIIKRIAVVNGGGGSSENSVITAKSLGADVYLSGDFKYNVFRLAKDLDYPVISIGHYNSEMPFIKLITELLLNKKVDNVHGATTCTDPLN